MDEPTKQLYLADDTGYRAIDGHRVYHINLIVQSRSGSSIEQSRFRIVLNKDGIKRVESVRVESVAKVRE